MKRFDKEWGGGKGVLYNYVLRARDSNFYKQWFRNVKIGKGAIRATSKFKIVS